MEGFQWRSDMINLLKIFIYSIENTLKRVRKTQGGPVVRGWNDIAVRWSQ